MFISGLKLASNLLPIKIVYRTLELERSTFRRHYNALIMQQQTTGHGAIWTMCVCRAISMILSFKADLHLLSFVLKRDLCRMGMWERRRKKRHSENKNREKLKHTLKKWMIVVEVNRVCSVWINLDCDARFRNLWRGAYTSTAWIACWFSRVRFWGTIAVKYERAEMGLKHVRSRWGSLRVGGEQWGVTEQTWKRLGEKKRHTGS